MADFVAEILAKLNLSQIPSDIQKIESMPVTLKNVSANTKDIVSQIQYELDKHKFNIDLNINGAQNLTKNVQTQGQQAGNSFVNGFVKATKRLGRSDIADMSKLMKGAGFKSSDIANATKDIENMNLEISKLVTTINKAGNVQLAFNGVDELGRAVTVIKELSKETGTISTISTHIKEEFDTSSKAANRYQKEVNSTFSELKSKIKEIEGIRIKLPGLEDGTSEKKALTERLKKVSKEYYSAYSEFEKDFSDAQKNVLKKQIEKSNASVKIGNGKANDKAFKQAVTEAFKRADDVIKQAEKEAKFIGSVSSGKNDVQAQKLKSRYENSRSVIKNGSNSQEIQNNLNQLYKQKAEINRLISSGDISGAVSAQEKFNQTLERLGNQLSIVESKSKGFVDSYKKIENSINTGSFDAQIQKMESQFEKFQKAAKSQGVSDEIKTNIDSLSSSKANIQALVQVGDVEGAVKEFLSYSQTLEILGNQFENVKNKSKDFNSTLKSIETNLQGGNFKTNQYDVLISKIYSRVDKLSTNSKVDLSSINLSPTKDSNGNSQLGNFKNELTKLKGDIEQAYSKGNFQGAISAHEQLIDLIRQANVAMDKLEISAEDYAAAIKRASEKSAKLTADIQAWAKANPKAAKMYSSQINDMYSKLRNNTDSKVLGDISTSFATLKSQAKAAGLTTSSFAKSLKDAALQAVGLNSVYDIFQKAVEVGKKMYQNVVEIDTAMTNLYKVTDETSERYNRFMSNSATSAKEIGRSVSSLINQSADWAKLGYSIDEAEQLAKVSSVYANVGEVGDDTAVSDLVTAMKAFNIEASDAITIVDALNELGNNFATSAANLGDGLSRSASSMKLAGTSANETLAMLTGISEITQNAPEAGNALKIFSMRVRGMKGKLEELGEEVDSSVDSISKVQTQILNLTNGRINIFDDNGEFRNYYEIMKDIADIFDELKSVDQANLSEVLFGKQRGNTGAALIQAFQSGQIEKALTAANESSGSAAREQSRWMESLEAKTGQLKAAWQELSQTTLNSDFLKNSIDRLRILTEYTTKAIDKFGLLPGVLAGSGIAAFIKNFGQPKAVMSTQKTSVYHGGRNIIMAILIIPWEESFKIRKGIIA